MYTIDQMRHLGIGPTNKLTQRTYAKNKHQTSTDEQQISTSSAMRKISKT